MGITGFDEISVQKQLLGEQVFRRLGEAIIDGTLPPGQRVRDLELAAELHVSRMPVREALQRLERIGMVEMLPSRSTRVTAVTEEDVRASREHAGYQAGIVAHMAVPRLDPDQRALAIRMVDAIVDALDEPAAASRRRRELFSALSALSGNRLHHAHLAEMELALERNLQHFVPDASEAAEQLELYSALREAIAAGDGDAAERIVRSLHGIECG
ncbi:GntR family transcriptional regulator [Microbacterium gilvum]|uniref:GntR family transcriptional regulator n=1 Tax=Microbacterium gilvum TaxID=1336204 RepID=A0ABP9ARL5_9MICO